MDSLATLPLDEELLPRACYELSRPYMAALAPDELVPLNIDIPSAVSTVLGVLPKLAAMRERLAVLAEFDFDAFDRLETYAGALMYVHARFMMTVQPHDDLNELADHGVRLRMSMVAQARALSHYGLVDLRPLENLTNRRSFAQLGGDLRLLARLFENYWPAIEGKCPMQQDEIRVADKLATRLQRLAGLRDHAPKLIRTAAETRLRAFTLLVLTYDDARRAVTYLCGRKQNPDEITPSLYGRRKRRKQADAETAPAGPVATDEAPSTLAITRPLALPPANSPFLPE
jgi:hypothetical protein